MFDATIEPSENALRISSKYEDLLHAQGAVQYYAKVWTRIKAIAEAAKAENEGTFDEDLAPNIQERLDSIMQEEMKYERFRSDAEE